MPTSLAWSPNGARVEREIDFDFTQLESIRLALRTPDFTTAERIEDAINRYFGRVVSRMLDSGTVLLDIKATRALNRPPMRLARSRTCRVEPERKARVVVDQRSGTIVMGRRRAHQPGGGESQGNLTLRIEEQPLVVQPNPFSPGDARSSCRAPRSGSRKSRRGIGLAEVPEDRHPNLSDVIAGLNALGVSPRDMIDILKSIKAAGAFHAEFIVR